MIKKKEMAQLDFYRLLSDLIEIKKDMDQKTTDTARKTLLEGYWQMGRRLCEEEAFANEISSATGPVITKLAQALNMEYSLLTRIIKFYKLWPLRKDLLTTPQVHWSHFRTLMTVHDPKEREYYRRLTQSNEWNARELRYRVQQRFYYHMKMRKVTERLGPDQNQIKKSKARLYIYAGSVARVVDGETLLVTSDLGFNIKMDMRLRLRGVIPVDSTSHASVSSGKTKKGKSSSLSKKFVEEKLKLVEKVIFQTYKVNLYGSYVADVYYLPGETNREMILKKGRFLNQELIDAGLALYKEKY